jgi:hypothetical protein
MSKKSWVVLLIAALVTIGVYRNLSRSSSLQQVTSSARSEGLGSSPGSSESRRPSVEFSGASTGGNSESLGFSSVPGWEDRSAKKRSAPPIQDEDENDEGEKKEELDQLIDEALHASDPDDRAYALNELGLWDATPEVLAACLEALDDPEEEVREEAVLALELLEDPSVIPALQRVAREDPSEDVRESAVEALEELME